jgi:hypothetical protein
MIAGLPDAGCTAGSPFGRQAAPSLADPKAAQAIKGGIRGAKPEITDKRGLTAHHVARHTGATLVSDAGASLAERMAAGGWESVQAAERYDHEDVERSRRALERL